MKVDKLISLLEQLNPKSEVLLYNGLTEDWHEIEIDSGELSRVKPAVRKQFIVMEDFELRGLPFPDKETLDNESKKLKIHKDDWGFNRYADDPEVYDFKTVSLLRGKPRNKIYSDRGGTVTY